MYDLIYVNGDSYMAGVGLAEEFYAPDHRYYKNSDWPRDAKFKSKLWKRRKNHHINIEYDRCLAAHLGYITNVSVINEATGGQSNHSTTIKASKSLIEYSKDKKILALIGLTGHQRIYWPTPDADKYNNNTLLFSVEENGLKNHVRKHFIQHCNDIDLYFSQLLPILGLYELFKNNKNVDLYFITTPLIDLQEMQSREYNSIIQSLQDKVIDHLGEGITEDTESFCADGHVIEKYHKESAKRIKEKLWK